MEETNNKKKAVYAAFNLLSQTNNVNPWSSDYVDKLEFSERDYNKVVEACRFFYQKDPIASSTINKLVEIGINDLLFSKNGLSDNEFRIFEAIKDMLLEFAEQMALEYLLSGLVVPDIKLSRVDSETVKQLGVKKKSTLMLPTSMWLRDPATIKIKSSVLSSTPSYFYKVPPNVVEFIMGNGKWNDGTTDEELWMTLKQNYGDFIEQIRNGKREFLLDQPELIIRRKFMVNNPYPIPYLYSALEQMKHKRNLRRMDYSIASRVISAIQLFKLGDKDFPLTEDNSEEQIEAVRQQMYYRESPNMDIERIFQLFANHTLQIEWIYPDTSALLNEQKYESINADIIYALGFPRILITGESQKTGTSDPQYAMMSPEKTMENFRKQILKVIKYIVYQVAEQNGLKDVPGVSFKPLRLFDYQTLLKSLADLYAGGNISRHTYSEELGYDWEDETDKREAEQAILKEKQLGEFAPQPFSNQPGQEMNPKNMQNNMKGVDKPSKPSDIKNTANNPNGNN